MRSVSATDTQSTGLAAELAAELAAGPPGCPTAGFSLVEALAALAIAAAAMAVVVQIAGTQLLHWSRGRDGAAMLDLLTTGLAQIGRDLRHTLPVPVRREPGAPVLFRGEPGRVQFAAATGFRPGDLGIEMIQIEAQTSAGGMALVRSRAPLSSGLDGDRRQAVSLFAGRLHVRFAYRDATGARFETWIDRPVLPAHIELEVSRPDGARVLGTPHLFAMPVDYSADCLDPDRDAKGGIERCGRALPAGGRPATPGSSPAPGISR